jgi:HD-GYP domain-containing protein (c-di-GMP phosphodiesterase class II)
VVAPVGGAETGVDSALVSRCSSPQALLQIAREYDRKGHLAETAPAYEAAIAAADAARDLATSAEALRRLAIVRLRRQETEEARSLCLRSRAVALAAGDAGLLAESLNTLGGFELVEERFDAARAFFLEAEALATDPDLQGRIEQNLGTVASIGGDHLGAMERYQRSLAGFLAAANDHGCAVAYHNLGVASIDLRRWVEADRYLRLSLHVVERTGDLHLRGLALLNHAEALRALGRSREARIAAEAAASIFDETHAPRELADAYRVMGAIYRDAGELIRAQTRLQLAVEVAVTSRCASSEAEATRELALVLASLGRRDEAMDLMARAVGQLDRLKGPAAPEQVLAGDYPAGVRAWGELMGALDPSALRHAERVAQGAVELARALGYDGDGQAKLRIGAYLHELDPERLAGGALPWDVGPMIRCHRERRDGSGRPLGLRDDAIPLDAEILGIVDVHDGGSASKVPADAWWRPAVVGAFRGLSAA